MSCLKLIWRILSTHSSLWVNWIRRYLIRESSFWSVKDSSSLGSWIWKKLLQYRDNSKTFTNAKIRNGVSTSFWYDEWNPLGRLINLTGIRGCIDKGIQLHTSVAIVIEMHRWRRHRVDVLNQTETIIETQRHKGTLPSGDVVLWRYKGDQYKA